MRISLKNLHSQQAKVKMFDYDELKACFIRRISVVSNAIQTIDNEMIHFIMYCLNCIQRD